MPSRIDRLCRRFELTIPLQRPVVVTYSHWVRFWETHQAVGLPHQISKSRQVLFVLSFNGVLHSVPKGCIIDIHALYPRKEETSERRQQPGTAPETPKPEHS
jgi:hypothetical protein